MTYIYECGDKDIYVWRNSEISDTVTIDNNENGKFTESKCPIVEDDKGQFFTYNNHKIYLDDYKRISIDYIKYKISRDERITDSELCQAIMSEGIDSVRFLVPMSPIDMKVNIGNRSIIAIDPSKNKINKVCHIVEEFNRRVEDCYKLKLYSDDGDDTVERYIDWYITDLVSSLMSGYVKIV